MHTRFLAGTTALSLLMMGCGVQQLPPTAAPSKVVPTEVEVPADPPAPGTGRVLIDTNGEAAKVVEITGAATASAGGYHTTVVGLRPLCTTPCVVDMTFGSHPLVLRSVSDESRQSETEIEVGARAKVFRHTLGERKSGGAPRVLGSSLMTLGILAVTTGAILWLAGSSSPSGSSLASTGQLMTGLGAGGIVLSIPLLIVGRPTERAGSTTQWTLPGSSSSPSTEAHAPAGAALDRL